MNLVYMWFNNEVIFFGVNDDGNRLTDNAESSYHSGVELSAAIQSSDALRFDANFSYNFNRYNRYITNVVVFDPSFNTVGVIASDFSDNTIPGFPELIGNLIVDYRADRFRLTYRFRGIGRQFVESSNNDSLSIAGFGISSVTGSVNLAESSLFGRVSLSASVNNIFDKLYIQSGYGGNSFNDTNLNYIDAWGAYFASSGRSFYTQITVAFD